MRSMRENTVVTSSPSTLAKRSDVTATSGWSSAKSRTRASTSSSDRSIGVVGAWVRRAVSRKK
jgi:hypothetical protein